MNTVREYLAARAGYSADAADGGFGIIEIIVALFLIAVIALALIPVFAATMALSQKNILVGRASQIASSQVSLADNQAALTSTCSAITSLAVAAGTTVPGTQNADLVYERDVSACPASYPGTMSVTIIVSKSAPREVLAQATTLVAVTGS